MKQTYLRGVIGVLALVAMLISVPYKSEASNLNCGLTPIPCSDSPSEGLTLFNSQTTGAATTAVTVTIAAAAGVRTHVYNIEGRCNTAAATSGLSITDGGTTIWSTVATEVLAATNFVRTWPVALTSATNSAIVVTLNACTAGTGTLIVEADRY